MSINTLEFNQLNRVLDQHTGIRLNSNKSDIMASRLSARLRATNCGSFNKYYQYIISPQGKNELDIFIDKMTTHETYFFREQPQFEFLYNYYRQKKSRNVPVRAWSAAASTGEEAYSIAMILDDLFYAGNWSVIGTDISPTAVDMAKDACFALSTVQKIPKKYRRAYCLKGTGKNEGTFTVNKSIRHHCNFNVDNLLKLRTVDYSFDIIFLRNVLIYFDEAKQQKIVDNIIHRLNHGGLLFLGHSESLRKKRNGIDLIQPCIYKKVRL
ncbi:methyltransferase domain-containing protein [Pseudoalteromonas sp. SMS1]|uniref:CheR family methyltransferase n=1 Tax=Pseudoalteromonas sp. SMS1 TaxID=2908894 RepID=UPI001F252032|nr:CheR family methyltransferase [Pseudoalteromonas sp. SMS1]MCF2858159.1 methyltransferase domain-containing protein [Pseudoalteromonas sp. SMS1]